MINKAERTEMLLAVRAYYNTYLVKKNIDNLRKLSDNELKKEYYSIFRKEFAIQ